jgi:hypothetical protein
MSGVPITIEADGESAVMQALERLLDAGCQPDKSFKTFIVSKPTRSSTADPSLSCDAA